MRTERTFAVRIDLRRTTAKGMRGDFDRRSMARNAASITADSVRGSAVARVRNPAFAAFVRQYNGCIYILKAPEMPRKWLLKSGNNVLGL